MDDFEEMKKNFDVFKDESGRLLLRPKKKPRTDFENSPLPSNSTYQNGMSTLPIIVTEDDDSMTVEFSDAMETSAQV
jgi:hypothetical protein